MLTIHNLPKYVNYGDIKNLIASKSNVKNAILTNLRDEGKGQRVDVSLQTVDNADSVRNIMNGMSYRGTRLFIVDKTHRAGTSLDKPRPPPLMPTPQRAGMGQPYGSNVPFQSSSSSTMFTPGSNVQDDQTSYNMEYVRQHGGSNTKDQGAYGLKQYNRESYDQKPYDQNSYNRRSYDQNPINQDAYGQNRYNKESFDQKPYNQESSVQNPYNRRSYDQNPNNQDAHGQNRYNKESYDQKPYNQESSNQNPYDRRSYDQNSNNQDAYGQNRYSKESYDQKPYNQESSNPNPFIRKSNDQNPNTQEAYGQNPYNKDSNDQKRYSPASFGQKPYYQIVHDQELMNKESYSQKPIDREPYGRRSASRESYGQRSVSRDSYGQKPYSNEPYGQKPNSRDSYGQQSYSSDSYDQDSYNQMSYREDSSNVKNPEPHMTARKEAQNQPWQGNGRADRNSTGQPQKRTWEQANEQRFKKGPNDWRQSGKKKKSKGKKKKATQSFDVNMLSTKTAQKRFNENYNIGGVMKIMYAVAGHLGLRHLLSAWTPFKGELKKIVQERVFNLVNFEELSHEEVFKRYRQEYPSNDDFGVRNSIEGIIGKIKEGQKDAPASSGVDAPKDQQQTSKWKKNKKKVKKLPPPLPPGKIPSYPQGDKQIHRQQKREQLEDMETLQTYSVPEHMQKAMDAEVDVIGTFISKEFNNPKNNTDKSVFAEVDREGCIHQCKKLFLHLISKRLSNSGAKVARIYGKPKIPKREELERFLIQYSCLSLKKSVKSPFYTASFESYGILDELFSMDPPVVGQNRIFFCPMHVGPKKPRLNHKRAKVIRRQYVNSQIDDSNVNLLSKDWQTQGQQVKNEKKESDEALLVCGDNNTDFSEDIDTDAGGKSLGNDDSETKNVDNESSESGNLGKEVMQTESQSVKEDEPKMQTSYDDTANPEPVEPEGDNSDAASVNFEDIEDNGDDWEDWGEDDGDEDDGVVGDDDY